MEVLGVSAGVGRWHLIEFLVRRLLVSPADGSGHLAKVLQLPLPLMTQGAESLKCPQNSRLNSCVEARSVPGGIFTQPAL